MVQSHLQFTQLLRLHGRLCDLFLALKIALVEPIVSVNVPA